MELKTIERAVLQSLENDVEARKSDFKLYIDVLEYFGINAEPFKKLVRDNGGNLPSLESVPRCRRKIQEERPDLKDTRISTFRRKVREPDYREYSRTMIGD